jgi:hypothetical protein
MAGCADIGRLNPLTQHLSSNFDDSSQRPIHLGGFDHTQPQPALNLASGNL